MQPALLIDARNVLYSAVYAGLNDRQSTRYHFFVILLRQLASLINIKRPRSVHIFWDAPRETLWRRGVLATYKDRSDSNYVEGLVEHLATTTKVAQDFFQHMNVRQYSRPNMEADDLLYAAVTLLHPQPNVIVSSDSDMMQMAYRYSSCTVYSPSEKANRLVPTVNPAHLKALMGDVADSIDGYYNIGPVRGKALLEDLTALREFLRIKGAEIYHRNLLLIDLSFCPRVLANTVYVQQQFSKPVKYSKDDINRLIMVHKVNGLQAEFPNLVLPFKNLV